MKINYLLTVTLGSIITFSGTWPSVSLAETLFPDNRVADLVYFSGEYNQLNVPVYSMAPASAGSKKSVRERYARIASSKWFKDAYEGKSLGDVIEIEF